MWFETTQLKSNIAKQDVKHIITQVLQVWECNKCYNTIYQQKYTYSPFQTEKIKYTAELSLENVNMKMTKCNQQKFMKIGFKNKPFVITNNVKIYCKFCKDQQILGELKPQIDMTRIQFHYALFPYFQNIKVTKMRYGVNNRTEITKSQSKLDSNLSAKMMQKPYQKLKRIQKQIQRYIFLWFAQKNTKIFKPFSDDSAKKRYQLSRMNKFILKMIPNREKAQEIVQKRMNKKSKRAHSKQPTQVLI